MSQLVFGSDHGGFGLKQDLIRMLDGSVHEVIDCGVHSTESVDYPDIAEKVCQQVLQTPGSLGVLLCGTGLGMSMAANKISGIRAALCAETFSARMARMHNDANVLCLGARVIGVELAKEVLDAFLAASFEGGRHEFRVQKITRLENRIP